MPRFYKYFTLNMSKLLSKLLPTSMLPHSTAQTGLASVWRYNMHTAVDSPVLQNIALSAPTMYADPSFMAVPTLPESCMTEVLSCELSLLSFHLNIAIKENIWKGEYVDLLKLLPSLKENRLEKRDCKNWRINGKGLVLVISTIGCKHFAYMLVLWVKNTQNCSVVCSNL